MLFLLPLCLLHVVLVFSKSASKKFGEWEKGIIFLAKERMFNQTLIPSVYRIEVNVHVKNE